MSRHRYKGLSEKEKKIGKEDEEKINNKIYLKKINKKLKNRKKRVY